MKAQTRKGALIESAANLAVGFGIAFLVNLIALPAMGMHPSATDLFGLGGIFTAVSVVRSYCLRRVFEWLRIRKAPPAFLYIVEELAAERTRQISGEGYDLAHDDEHVDGQLAMAAATYLLASVNIMDAEVAANPSVRPLGGTAARMIRDLWPWDLHYLKPQSRRRCLEKAGALLIAEIGRQDRRALKATTP